MSNPFRAQIEQLVNSKMGTNTNRMITGVVTKVDGANGKCTVCPIDIDAMWEMKKYYARTNIDRVAAQNIIENVLLGASSGIKINQVAKGDKVVIGYNEDMPYLIQKIKQSYSHDKAISGVDGETTIYQWLDEGGEFGNFKEFSPITNNSMDGT